MKQIVFDYESLYSKDYTLKQMTPVEYVLDPRFECIGCSVKIDGGEAFFLEELELFDFLSDLGDEKIVAISHNALFDMAIMAWRFGYVPHLMVDTLGMARAWLAPYLRSLSLKNVALYLGIGAKGDTVMKVIGMSKAAIKAAGLWDEYVDYCKTDSDLCWGIYRYLVDEGFPVSELAVMDNVLRACIEPGFSLDRQKLIEHLNDVVTSKAILLQKSNLASRDDLMSNDKFAAALERLGVDVPMKTSVTTGKQIYAFAKTDPDFLDLEEHEDPAVQALVAARLGVKSTIEETRTQRLINISNLTWPKYLDVDPRYPPLPMPLKYSGAHTHRLGGDWKLNMQNLPVRNNNKIRKAIVVPPGKRVVVVDASQIEARGVSTFCGAENMRIAFAEGRDLYSEFASTIFGWTVTRANPPQRFVGKTAILGLGYGLGWLKFQLRILIDSLAQTGEQIVLDDAESQRVVYAYRTKYDPVPRMWKRLENIITQMTFKDCHIELGPVTVKFEEILLPNGLSLYFHNLRYEDNGWRFDYNGRIKYIYGGKLLENIIQALARIIIMDAGVRIRRRLGFHFHLQVHDELAFVVASELADELLQCALEELRVPPHWDPRWPLDAEGSVADTYGDAK